MCPVIWQIDAVVHCWHFVEILQCLFCNYLRNFDLGALAYLHKRRVLHRDVKPSHIFIGETGQADQLFRNHLPSALIIFAPLWCQSTCCHEWSSGLSQAKLGDFGLSKAGVRNFGELSNLRKMVKGH